MLNLIEFVIEPPTGDTGAKYNILKEIEKRNKQEEKIKEQIEAFEKLNDFSKLFTQYTIRNRNKLNVFFLPETKGNSSQLFDDFDRAIASGKNYKIEDMENQMAAEP